MRFLSCAQVAFKDDFFSSVQEKTRAVTLPFQWRLLCDDVPGAEKSYSIHNFKVAAGREQGEHQGMVFQDSDLYKWIEAAASALVLRRDDQLEALCDGVSELIAAAQQPDGYIGTYYTLREPEGRFGNLQEGHELYCAGHLFEAAVVYFEATGKTVLLDAARRFADLLVREFLRGGRDGYPGHPEIELGLLRLWTLTGEPSYFDLARHFLLVRGADTAFYARERERAAWRGVWSRKESRIEPEYSQAGAPLAEQREAVGHAVRAMYLYTALAFYAREGGGDLADAARRLYENTVTRQMYVTGGIGSCADGERFTCDYDLPNEAAYCETCASIGLMRFSEQMFLLDDKASAYDAWERALHNTVLAGVGEDGMHFFYVNPLDVRPDAIAHNPALRHVKPRRPEWYGCACCPPNAARAILSLGGRVLAEDERTFTVLSHIACAFDSGLSKGGLARSGDRYTLSLDRAACLIRLRVPEGFRYAGGGEERDGYITLAHAGGMARYEYALEPLTRVLRAHPAVGADVGLVCVSRGSVLYCLEGCDNGSPLSALYLDASKPIVPAPLPDVPDALAAQGLRVTDEAWRGALYTDQAPSCEPVTLRLVPYRAWGNRGEGEMRVWLGDARCVRAACE